MSQGGMQLLSIYRSKLSPAFVRWYLSEFVHGRMHFIHWPVGGCEQDFPEYNECIRYTPEVGAHVTGRIDAAVDVEFPDTQDPAAATSDRNTNSWATAVDGFAGATADDLGPNVCYPDQLRLLVEQCAKTHLALRVPVGNIMTHAEAADCVDGYQDPQGPYGPTHGATRWDFHVWIDPRTLALKSAFHPCPQWWLYFPDWLRGETIMRIQALTQHIWGAIPGGGYILPWPGPATSGA